jgi:3-hydroxyisobutyrate dehydrogenase
MGKHMVANLIKNGHTVTVYDSECPTHIFPCSESALKMHFQLLNPAVAPAAVRDAVAKGASAATSAAGTAMDADVVITMLPNSPHVAEALEGVLKSAKAGTLLIDSSTIDPSVSKALAARASAAKLRMIDAPVSGGVGGAEAGTLTFMVGGAESDFEDAKAGVLTAMGKNIVHCGEVGAGQVAKICNNMILGVCMTAISEAMNLGVKLGADPKKLAGIINTSSGRCWSSDTYNPVPGVMPNVPASRGYTGGFAASLLSKDMGLALAAGKAAGAPLPAAAASAAMYELMLAQGFGGKDFSAIYAFLRGELKSNPPGA